MKRLYSIYSSDNNKTSERPKNFYSNELKLTPKFQSTKNYPKSISPLNMIPKTTTSKNIRKYSSVS